MQQACQDLAFDDQILAEQNRNVKSNQVIKDLLEDGGVNILFSGCIERVMRSAPQFGVTLAVFDVLNSAAVEHGWIAASTPI